ncbi:MAG: hypothetical protein HRT54_16905 [Colwellia sp.]|nr:hypothetical protein [Colwellia sp.]
MPYSQEFTLMPKDGSAHTRDEWKLLKAEIDKRKPIVLKHIDRSTHMSQGFRLVDQKAYSTALKELEVKMKSKSYLATDEGRVAQIMHSILTDDMAFKTYLSDEMKSRVSLGVGSKSSISTKGASLTSKMQLANARLKRKQLFMMYKEIIKAQEELKEFSKYIVSLFSGKLSVPPGAYGGIKSFSGALDKITNRNPMDDIGDLKDCARMTVEFTHVKDMAAAKHFITRTDEFREVQHFQSALKDRYSFASKGSQLSRFNKGAQKSGYKDIKFFLKMRNGMIGELQLNTTGMLIAKEKEHVIYDILRDAPKGANTFTINNPNVLKTVLHHMNGDWFSFIGTRVPSVKVPLAVVRAMIDRLSTSPSTLTVSNVEKEALISVSLALYVKGEKGVALL